jgi:hypothetical protein
LACAGQRFCGQESCCRPSFDERKRLFFLIAHFSKGTLQPMIQLNHRASKPCLTDGKGAQAGFEMGIFFRDLTLVALLNVGWLDS